MAKCRGYHSGWTQCWSCARRRILLRVRFTSTKTGGSVFVYFLMTSLACTPTGLVAHSVTCTTAEAHRERSTFNSLSKSATKSSSTRCRILTASLSPRMFLTVGSVLVLSVTIKVIAIATSSIAEIPRDRGFMPYHVCMLRKAEKAIEIWPKVNTDLIRFMSHCLLFLLGLNQDSVSRTKQFTIFYYCTFWLMSYVYNFVNSDVCLCVRVSVKGHSNW